MRFLFLGLQMLLSRFLLLLCFGEKQANEMPLNGKEACKMV